MSGIIFCNLKKAFDSVNHDIILSKLSYYGISGMAKLLSNLIFRKDITEFKSLTDILILT
jgi:hypothetical protein